MKIRVEIIKFRREKQLKNETKNWIFEKINSFDKTLARVTKNKIEAIPISCIRNFFKVWHYHWPSKNKRIIKEYYE